jgi:hypothetical protein
MISIDMIERDTMIYHNMHAQVPDGKGGRTYRVMKLLSEDPANYPDAPREGIRRILEQVTGKVRLYAIRCKHPSVHPGRLTALVWASRVARVSAQRSL